MMRNDFKADMTLMREERRQDKEEMREVRLRDREEAKTSRLNIEVKYLKLLIITNPNCPQCPALSKYLNYHKSELSGLVQIFELSQIRTVRPCSNI